MRALARLAMSLAVLLSAAICAHASPPLRIGLALGGGSARGIAHVGVLEWLEHNHVPIDYVAGTSMGGLVGGAYATGMTPAEIREMLAGVDWDLMFLPDVPFKSKTFRRKQDSRAFPTAIELGLRGGIRFPSGLNSGQQVELLLDRIALPCWDAGSFDELPVPFRCVATDLRRVEAVALDRGPLARALRATMAIPGVFAPVEIDGRTLVDGGVINNVPADVVRAMGADIVIAVDVGIDPMTAAQQQSLFGVLGQTIDAMMLPNVRQSLACADIVVRPDLRGLGSIDWRRSDEMADRGYAAADTLRDRLCALSVDEGTYSHREELRTAVRRKPLPSPVSLTVTGIRPAEQAEVRRQLRGYLSHELQVERLAADLTEVTGTERYETATYSLCTTPDGPNLMVDVHPKSHGPPFLNLAFDLGTTSSADFTAALRGRITTFDTIGSESEIRADFGLGTGITGGIELYRPFSKVRQGFFVAPRATFEQRLLNGYVGDEFLAQYRFRRSAGALDVGFGTGACTEVRAGVEIADVRQRVRIGDPVLTEIDGWERFVRIQYERDGQTSPLVPTRGVHVVAQLRRYYGVAGAKSGDEPIRGPDRFWRAQVDLSWFHSASRRNRMFALFSGGTSFSAQPLPPNDFTLGGLLRLSALNNDELRGSRMLFLATGWLHQIGRLPDMLGGPVHASLWIEEGSAFESFDGAQLRTNITGGIIFETLFGPFFIGESGGFGNGAQSRFYISLGPLFR
ncbi:MAG: patatin-like phospholipase family protein [Acidobacteriota bacterium]